MACCPPSPDMFAFAPPPAAYRPLPFVEDEDCPSKPAPLVLPAAMIADSYVASYLPREHPFRGNPFTQGLNGRRTEPPKDSPYALGTESYSQDAPSHLCHHRPTSASSFSSLSSSSTWTSVQTRSTERRPLPSIKRLPSPPIPPLWRPTTWRKELSDAQSARTVRDSIAIPSLLLPWPTLPAATRTRSESAIENWQAGVRVPSETPPGPRRQKSYEKLSFGARRVLFQWLLEACSDAGGRHPYMSLADCDMFARRLGITSTQVRTWCVKARHRILGWDREFKLVTDLTKTKAMADQLGLPMPNLPTAPHTSAGISFAEQAPHGGNDNERC